MKYLLTLFNFFMQALALAGTVGPTTITLVDLRNDGTFLITTAQAITNSPNCVNVNNRMSADSKTPGGKIILAGALSAYHGSKQIGL